MYGASPGAIMAGDCKQNFVPTSGECDNAAADLAGLDEAQVGSRRKR
jgi:hypothetical protein